MKKLTQARLKELLNYNPETGVFTRTKTISGKAKKGDLAGCINRKGYINIGIDFKTYLAHRLAWLYVEGYFPENEIDHINRIKHDNRWKNLRHVSRQCNVINCNLYSTNKSGVNGISWSESRQKWCAGIMVSGKKFSLGRFNSKLDAALARWNAEVEHGFPNCNTTSSAYLYLHQTKHKNRIEIENTTRKI